MKNDTQSWTLTDPVTVLPQVGAARSRQLELLGIASLGDLLLHLPHRYEDRSRVLRIEEIEPGEACSVFGEVIAATQRRIAGRGVLFEAKISDDSGVLHCSWFNAAYLGDVLKEGVSVFLYGRVDLYKERLSMNHPDYEVMDSDVSDWAPAGVVAVYPGTEGMSQKLFRGWIELVLARFSDSLDERIPVDIRDRCGLKSLSWSIRQVHCPDNIDLALTARFRMVFEEFLEIQLILALRKSHYKTRLAGIEHAGDGHLTTALLDSLPFDLTEDQATVLREIQSDMALGKPLHRLLQGDVGSGKTVVAVLAMLTALESGSQSALMVPTEVLAAQHIVTLGRLLGPLGVRSEGVVGGMGAVERRDVLARVASGETQIVVGTHALIQDGVEFKRLGMVVIDEQHKFGVSQRGQLVAKGVQPDCLVMTATPIPRTLAMTIYGDLDVSVIRSAPIGRLPIQTRVIGEDKLEAAYEFICKQVGKGRQAYIVYPLVEESETLSLKSASERFLALSQGVFQGLRTGLVHGRLSGSDKAAVMEGFVDGTIDVLLSTTVVEVGLDVANATVMLVENAERFGLAQLHQLRGRVGRGVHKSFCVLQGEAKSRDSWRRMKVMEETCDGFLIAEEDIKIRGMGNLLGREQSGLPRLRVADPIADVDVLKVARSEALDLVSRDPGLVLEEHAALKKRIVTLYEAVKEYVEVG